MAFRSSNVAQTADGTSALTGNAPAGVTAGDRLLALVVQDNSAAVFTPATGWTSLGAFDCSGPDGQSAEVFEKKVATGSDAYNFTSTNTESAIIHTVALTGRHATSAAVVQSTVNTNSNATPISVALGGVTAVAGDDLVWFAQLDTNIGADVWGFSGLSGFTERQDTSNGDFIVASTWTQDGVGAGATGTLTATATRSSGTGAAGWSGMVVAVPSVGVTLEQEGARFGVDDGNEASHTWAAAQDADTTQPIGTNLLLRVLVNASGDPATAAYTLRAQKNGSGGYAAVPVGASIAEAYGTVTYGAVGTGANGSTTVAPSYPTGITAGQYLIAVVTSGSTANATPTDSGSKWGSPLASGASTDGTYGVDAGPRRVTVFGCIADGTETGTYTFNISGGGTCRGTIHRFTKAGSGSWSVSAQGANDSTSGTGVSMTFASMNWNTGDATLVAVGQRVDTGTQSSQSLTASGVTFGTRTNRETTAVTTGNDHRHVVDTFAAITGTSNVDAAPTWAYTASTSVSAGGVIVRLREYTAPVTNGLYVATSANITAGGEATTARLTAPSGKSTSDFVTGRRWDDENGTDSIDITTDDYTELEWCLRTQSPTVDTDYFDFRVYAGAVALGTYTDTPRWTVGVSGISADRAESIGLADSQTVTTVFSSARAESLALADAQTVAMTASVARAESVALADAQTSSITIPVAEAESFAVADSQTAASAIAAAVSESLTLADTQVGLTTAIYYVIGPNAGWATPSATEIKAGQLSGGGAATASGSEASPLVSTSPFTFSSAATGLSSSTAYRIAFVWSDSVDNSNVAVGSFSTTANFNVDRAESVALVDAQTVTAVFSSASAESLALADSQSAVAVFSVASAESVGLADSQSSIATFSAARAESVGLADSQSSIATFEIARAESIGLADAQTAATVAAAAQAESLTLADAQTAATVAAAAQAESLALADAQTAATVAAAAAQAESLALADAQTAATVAAAAQAESLALADAQTAATVAAAAQAESLTLADAQTAATVAAAAQAESLALADAQTAGTATTVAQDESLALSDAQTGIIPTLLSAQDESVSLADAQTSTALLVASRAESVALADTQTFTVTYSNARAESISLADSQSAAAVFQTAQAEALALSDAQTALITQDVLRAESIGLADAQSAITILTSARAESVALADSQSANAEFNVDRAESVGLADSQNVATLLSDTREEAFTLADAQTATRIAVASQDESLTLADTQDGALAAADSLRAESLTLADAQTSTAVLAGAQVESIALVDAQTVSAVLTVSRAETLALSDSQTGAFLSTTIYYVIGWATGWVNPTAAQIKTGQLFGGAPAAAYGSRASPTVTTAPFTFSTPATGLVPSTAYKIAFVWSDGTNDSNVAVGSFSSAPVTQGESFVVSDSQSAAKVTSVLTIADAFALADGQSATKVANATRAETFALSDGQSAEKITSTTCAETFGLSDGQSSTLISAGPGAAALTVTGNISGTGWAAMPPGPLFEAIDEASPDDADYIYAGASTPHLAVFEIPYLGPGLHIISIRSSITFGSTSFRVLLRDSFGIDVGSSAWQTTNPTWTTYPLAVTIASGVASQLAIELSSVSLGLEGLISTEGGPISTEDGYLCLV